MESRLSRILILSTFAAVAVLAAVLLLATGALAQGAGQPVVELRYEGSPTPGDVTYQSLFPNQRISGTDSSTRQAYKFQRQREGKDFSYAIGNLSPNTYYSLELSFVEHDWSAAGKRVFNVYIDTWKCLSNLDVYKQVGKNTVYQRVYPSMNSGADGVIKVRFRSNEAGGKDYATISTVRVYRGSTSAVEIDASKSRLNMDEPTRFTNAEGQDSYETALGRLGSRFSLNLLPQKLGARFSSLGDGTGDLSDLVLGLTTNGADMRCLPFTDRYPVWDQMDFKQTMTSQTYTCSTTEVPGLSGLKMTVTFRSPFYPGTGTGTAMEKLSGAPFFYVDVTVENTAADPKSASFVFARPHSGYTSGAPAEFTDADASGYSFATKYNYYDESYNLTKAKPANEALAVPLAEAADVSFHGTVSSGDYSTFSSDSLWGAYQSPSGYPRTYSDYKKPIYSFYPRGYSGAVWEITNLPPGPANAVTKHFVMAGYVPGSVLTIANSSYSGAFKYKYTKDFTGVDKVVDYAVTNRMSGDAAETRSEFFDRTISDDSYLMLPKSYSASAKNLIAYSFQSFLMNTWWAVSNGHEWFSVWEGSSCRFHSTVDVEYNQAWFYFYYWPDLLKKIMDEWVLYPNTCQQGTYLSHDMGYGDEATGQSFPTNMAVEENADYVLLLYKYWKCTGDTAYVRSRFGTVKELMDFIANCDGNNNGIPDQYMTNTLDQASLAIQNGKDQTYLGYKCLAAYQATREMAMAQAVPDGNFAEKCRAEVESINQTLEYDSWLSDHYAVCVDDDVLAADREAYNIYASNGLVYLLGGTRAAGVTSTNTERLKQDLVNSTAKTLKTYGCTHSSYDAYNEWVSQNVWRDQAACMLGVNLDGKNPMAMSSRYWRLQQYFAKSLWGTYWDVVIYPGGATGGASVKDATTSRGDGGGSLVPPYASKPGRADGGKYGSGGRRTTTPKSGGASSYGQSLGYYPRGAASLGLLESAAGLTIDGPDDSMYYRQTAYPMRVPVFERAAWGNADEATRVPTLTFAGPAGAPVVTNRNLLPTTLAARNTRDMTGVSAGSRAISPNGDGINDQATISYSLPNSATVTRSIWDGSKLIKSYPALSQGPGAKTFAWDGRDDGGEVAGDGVYTAKIDARSTDAAYEIRPASTPVYVNNTIPDLSTEWYLAEGFTGRNATGGEFEEYVLVQNPNAEPANLQVTFMLTGGRTEERSYVVPAASRFTITVDDILPDAEVSTYIRSDRPVAAERAMYFNGRKAGHDSIGVSQPSKTWYLAEGYTAESFDEYVLIQNPGAEAADVTAVFMTQGAGNQMRQYTVGPHSRFTIHVDDIVPADSVSTAIKSTQPVVVERAQYLNNMTAGTCSIGAVSSSRTWYLAEGYTDQGFEDWVLIQNPQPTYNNVTVTFMEKGGTNTVKQYLLPPESRFTIQVGLYLPASEVSVKVRSQDPVIVERAMYWNNRSDGHDSVGTPTPDSEWYLPEGYTDKGFETWVLVQNPGDEQRNVTMTFMEPGGRNTVRVYVVPPRSRFTVGVDDVLPAAEVSTHVSADGPVIVERAIYFNNRSGGTDSVGIR